MKEILVSEAKVIEHPAGNIYHGIKKSNKNFSGFGELYFSKIKYGEIKGWKKHTQMISHLFVPTGRVKFVFFDGENFAEYVLGEKNYKKLIVHPGLWMAFQGLDRDDNLVTNLASIEHDPAEAVNRDLKDIEYEWTL